MVCGRVPEIFGLLASFVHLNIPTKINLPKKEGATRKLTPQNSTFRSQIDPKTPFFGGFAANRDTL